MCGGENIRCRKEDKLPREMQRGAYKVRWCNDNIADCRSAATGLIPVRTAVHSSIPIGWILRLERRGCRFEPCLLYKLMWQCDDMPMRPWLPDGVIGNISEFESDVLGSNLSPVTKRILSKEQGMSNAEGVSPMFIILLFLVRYSTGLSFNGRTLCYERRDESSTLSKPTMARSSMEDVSGF